MAQKRPIPPPRKPRADALRNRERILEVAKHAFAHSGGDVSLDDIAKSAGVGPGTLYRHFPNRGDLLEAVYRTEVEKLAVAHHDYAKTLPPAEALRAWMLLFVDYIATKQLIAPALNSLMTDTSELYESSRSRITGAIFALVQAAVKSGDMRKDIDPMDLLRALVGVSNVASVPNWPQSAKKLVDILIAGSRPEAESAPNKSAKPVKA
ncbi:MAG TPA: TetR/AcrR family transcriptional regulator [Candidatus Methylacidiphilales bacterium]|jgi:AcrR family transcriptional regulator|nr:TetR/AcrR family transcriptional regulator [Candidatus Methylacidiphilales bacterium]